MKGKTKIGFAAVLLAGVGLLIALLKRK